MNVHGPSGIFLLVIRFLLKELSLILIVGLTVLLGGGLNQYKKIITYLNIHESQENKSPMKNKGHKI